MDNDPVKLYNKKVFSKLFESSNDSDEKLYKNTLLEFDEENPKKELDENNSELNIKEFTHNALLKRVAMEDYSLFPPKNEPIQIIEEGNLIEKEEPEKLYEEEVDFLQKINRINYLTFSPFGESFFPHQNKNDPNEEDNNDNTINTNNNSKKENKLLDILDFEYDNYVINNDLLFNISMGYIDINKLKKENAVKDDNFTSKNDRINKAKKQERFLAKIGKENSEQTEFKYEIPFKQELFLFLQSFALQYKKEEFFQKILNEFYMDMNNLNQLEKNKEKNKILIKWEKEFKEQQIKYNLYKQKKEREERIKRKIQKEIEQKMKDEKMKVIEEQKKLENELNKIRNKAKRRNTINAQKKLGNKSVESSLSNINNKNIIPNDIRNSVKKDRPKRIRTISYKKKGEDKYSRINWNNQKKDYAFGNL